MVRSRPPKKLRKVCRLIFQVIEKNEKTTFPYTPHNPRGLIALIFEGSKVFVLRAGNVSPFTFEDFLAWQTLKNNAPAPSTTQEKTPYIS